MFDYRKLSEAKIDLVPWPHYVIDNLWSGDQLDCIVDEFEAVKKWDSRADYGIQVKDRTAWGDEFDMGHYTSDAVETLHGAKFLNILSKLTGIDGLIPDPYLAGGGLNQIKRGGQLAVHVDGTWHHGMKLHRRVNVIVYLNSFWNEDWNGHFQLWSGSENPVALVKEYMPAFNRTVIFPTNDLTWHGHPEKLDCPDGVTRKSLILYYYTSERPASDRWNGRTDVHHSAVFVETEQ